MESVFISHRYDDFLPNYGRRLEPHLKNLAVPNTFFMKSKLCLRILPWILFPQKCAKQKENSRSLKNMWRQRVHFDLQVLLKHHCMLEELIKFNCCLFVFLKFQRVCFHYLFYKRGSAAGRLYRRVSSQESHQNKGVRRTTGSVLFKI